MTAIRSLDSLFICRHQRYGFFPWRLHRRWRRFVKNRQLAALLRPWQFRTVPECDQPVVRACRRRTANRRRSACPTSLLLYHWPVSIFLALDPSSWNLLRFASKHAQACFLDSSLRFKEITAGHSAEYKKEGTARA